jgi:hypothetical protein
MITIAESTTNIEPFKNIDLGLGQSDPITHQ